MKPFCTTLNVLGIAIATLLAVKGMKRKSLSKMGAMAAFIVGYFSIACGLRGFVLLVFYLIGTKATKFKHDFKEKIDGDAGKSSIRGPHQVLACSGIAVILSLYHVYQYGEEKMIGKILSLMCLGFVTSEFSSDIYPHLFYNQDFQVYSKESCIAAAIISHYATCLADTLASEMGILSKSDPFLIIVPHKKVPPGTNGGVTLSGFAWSAFGGFVIGIATLFLDTISGIQCRAFELLLFSSICGLMGSIVDSILGALLQATYYDKENKMVYCSSTDIPRDATLLCGFNLLTNAQVNLVSVLLTTVIGGYCLGPLVFR